MTSRLYIQKRGPAGGAHVEYSAFTGRKGIPFFDGQLSLIELGQRFANGEAAQGTFVLSDPSAELPDADFDYNLPAHALVTWTEDAPGAEVWMARGRIADYEGGRGIPRIDDETEFEVTIDDGNVELRGQAFTEAWARPSETDVARLLALQAYTLNGASSTADHHRDTCAVTVSTTHLCPNTGTVTMPAKKYLPGTQPQEVIDDCAQMAGKLYGVVIHHTGGSHLCLLYISDEDHSTYASPGKISDHLDEWDPVDPSAPVWEPNWQAGKATLYSGQALLSGLVGLFGTEGAAFAEYADNVEDYDYWVEHYSDGRSTSLAQATTRAAGMLEGRRATIVTHRPSIIVQADQVDMIAAGMSIQVKASAALGGQYLDTWQTRRIVECRFEPRPDGSYWAHLNLERPPLIVGPPTGRSAPVPPVQSEPSSETTDWLWTFDTDGFDDLTGTHEGGPKYNAAGYIYSGGLDPSCEIGSGTGGPVELAEGDYTMRIIMRSRSPSGALKGVRISGLGGTIVESGAIVGNAATELTLDFSIDPGGDAIQITSYGPGNNTEFHEVEITHGAGVPAFIGTQPPPPATDQVGTTGSSSTYSPIDHAHGAQGAGVTTVADEAGYYEGAETVEEALALAVLTVDDGTTEVVPVRRINLDGATLTDDGDAEITITFEAGDGGGQVLPLTAVDGGTPVLVWDDDDSLIPTEVVP